MTGLEIAFTALAVAGFGATAWIAGIIAWRLLRSPKK